MKFGGCDNRDRTVNLYFDQTPELWEDVMIATGPKIHLYDVYSRTCNKGECYKFNVDWHGKDRVGFRIPKGGWNGFFTNSFWGPLE